MHSARDRKLPSHKVGSRARIFLDSRGMIHIVSSDKKLPQLTLVLCDGAMAGWTSDGRTFGRAYFLPDKATDEPAPEGESTAAA